MEKTKPFTELLPGDKFTLDVWGDGDPVIGVCVLAPVVFETKKRLFRKPVVTYTAVCIELHPFLGACEWNPRYTNETIVEILS